MRNYLNKNGDSGIESYEYGMDYILIKFKNTNKLYRYSTKKNNKTTINEMKNLADKGYGLHSYLIRNCYGTYD